MFGQSVKGAIQARVLPFSVHAAGGNGAASNAFEHFVVELHRIVFFLGFALRRGRRRLRLAVVRLALATVLRFGSAHDGFSCALRPVADGFRNTHLANSRTNAFHGRMLLLALRAVFVPDRICHILQAL